jgi:RimJ/RimL family protein N-acetyltransferase
MKIFAETERLILREILPSDIEGLFELDSDPEVHRYLGNKPITDKAQIVDVINFIRQQYHDNGIGRWAIIDKKSNDFIGWIGLKFVTDLINNHKNYYDLGYRLIRKYWGQGIATETAIASLDYAFDILKVEEVYAAASCQNIGSNKILQKVGLSLIEIFYYEDIECNWYKIDKNDYEKNKKPDR